MKYFSKSAKLCIIVAEDYDFKNIAQMKYISIFIEFQNQGVDQFTTFLNT